MNRLLIKNVVNAHVAVPLLVDVLIQNGQIVKIGPLLPETGVQMVYDGQGVYVSSGFTDMHVHITVPGLTQIQGHEMGVDVEQYGVRTGVGTLVDAGSFGADNIEKALDYTVGKQTRVLFLMNASRTGIRPGTPELEDLDKIDIQAAEKVYAKHADRIVGLKARASISASGKAGIKAIVKAKQLAVALNLPMMVHVGNAPPLIEEVLETLTEGDIITHCFHGKRSNAILTENDEIKPEALAARERGVLFDIGHGTESFNYAVTQKMIGKNFLPDTISTDLHVLNAKGPVLSLPVTVNKFMTLNGSVQPWLDMITERARKAFKLTPVNSLGEGQFADLVLFRLDPAEETYFDSDGNPIPVQKKLAVLKTIKGNALLPVD